MELDKTKEYQFIYKHIIISGVIYLILPFLIYMVYLKHSNECLLSSQQWLLNFDAVHYFRNEYLYQPNFAFFPFYVYFNRFLQKYFGLTSAIYIPIIINKIAYAVAAFQLYEILKIIRKNNEEKQKKTDDSKDIPKLGVLFFLYNPAGIFFNSIYTESLFTLLVFHGTRRVLQQRSPLIASFFFGGAALFRSSALFFSPIVGLSILKNFFSSITRNWKYAFLLVNKGIFILGMIIAPMLLHNYFTYYKICIQTNSTATVCQKNFMDFYSYIQESYWNVGFLTYFNIRNIIFILIGAPALIIGLLSLFLYKISFNVHENGIYLSFLILFFITACFTNIQSSTRFFCSHPYFYYALARLNQKSSIISIWSSFYWLVGILLFVVSFPWT